MALNLANVELTDTFNTWRVRTNSVIGEAVSGTSTTSQTITANVTFSGTVTVPTLNATTISTSGTVSAGDFSGNGASVTSVDAVTLDSLDSTQFLRSDAADSKTSGDLTFNDNVKAVFGTGSDLEIYHDASNSIINDAGTGNLKIQQGASDRVLVNGTGGTLYGNWTVTQNMVVDGDFTVNGNTKTINVENFEVNDNLIHIAANNVADTLDSGFLIHYTADGANNHAGFYRDSGTKEFYVFSTFGPDTDPISSINPGDGSFALANVNAAFFKGDGSQLTNAGSTVATQSTGNVELFIPFTGISSGTMTSANVNSGFTFNPSSGQATAVDFNSTSDERFKSNVKVIDNAVDKVMKLDGVYFDWIANGEKSMGVIAQQIEDVVPEVVSTDNKGFKSVSYGKLVGLLIQAIKEQQETINNIKS